MKIKVINRNDPSLYAVYDNVTDVVDTFDEKRTYCHQVRMADGNTATHPACEGAFFELTWAPMF